jgi:hypothetical protein
VFVEPWQNDFARQRNISLEKAAGVWCWIVDADEEYLPGDPAQTRWHLEHDDLPPILLVRLLLAYPEGRQVTMLAPRFLRKDSGYRYVHPVHEQLNVTDSRAMLTDVHLLHHGYSVPEALGRKERRNLAIAMAMEPNAHALHCRARSCLSLSDWEGVRRACAELAERIDAGLPLRLEACVMGAVAGYNLADAGSMERFAKGAQAIAPDAPDVRFVELVSAAWRYLESLKDGDATTPGAFIRPWMFWHDARQVQMLVETLLGKRRIVDRAELPAREVPAVGKSEPNRPA